MTLIADAPAAGVPTGREEAWRFTPLGRLRGLHESVVGAVAPDVSVELAPGASFESVDTATLPGPLRPIEGPSLMAREAAERSGLLVLAAGSDSAEASVVRLHSSDSGTTVAHLVIRAEAGSRGAVMIEHTGPATLSGNVEVDVADGAELTLVSVQAWDADAVHLGRVHAQLGRDARFRSLVVSLGGDVVRLAHTVGYSAPGGEAELFGAFLASDGQHLEHRLLVDHTAPHCRSNVVYKGALQGAGARSVWIGDVVIRASAVGTETYEINRNLLLTDGAHADSVPNLEIETGDVRSAGHASATGRFDDEQLFYLQSRGIDADTARRLVVRGFFADILNRSGLAGLSERLMADIETRLGHVPADEEN